MLPNSTNNDNIVPILRSAMLLGRGKGGEEVCRDCLLGSGAPHWRESDAPKTLGSLCCCIKLMAVQISSSSPSSFLGLWIV